VLLAKIMFTVAAAVFHLAFLWGVKAAWDALPAWGFLLALCLYLPPSTWLLYLAGMAIDRAKDEDRSLPELSAYLSILFAPLASFHNFLNNMLPMTALFLDLPRELATTKRMNRYADGPDGLRKKGALAIREQLLNVFDWRGIHT
jgi:phosphate/sulfate permease